jgi:hypothetical protein
VSAFDASSSWVISAAHRARRTLAPTALENARKFTRTSRPHDCLILDTTKGL